MAVVKGNNVVYANGYGSANLEYGIPITPNTVFHVASVSKQFTAFAVTLLADQGKLSLDDDIRLHLPEIPDFGKTITLRHLIHHISGLRDQWELLAMAGWRLDDVITKNHILKMVKNQRDLNFNPGEEYLYCNTGYTLLAEIVERVTGQSFTEWTTTNIFEPLGMTDTHFHDDHEKIVKNRAYSYSPQGKGFRKRVLSYANVGATSLFTTAEDLARWMINFGHITVGNQSVIDRMQVQGKLNNGQEISYASGLVIGETFGQKTVGHSGSDAGFRSHVLRFPEEDLSVIVLSNLSSINPGRLAGQVAETYVSRRIKSKKKEGQTEEIEEFQIDPTRLNTYRGYYRIRPDYVIFIDRQDNRLTAQVTGGQRYTLFALSETRFSRRDVDAEYLFHLNNIGDVTGLTLKENSRTQKGEKIAQPALSPLQRQAYTGKFYSPELDTFYRIVLEEGQLIARHRKHDDISLTLITPDHFSGGAWFFRIVRFVRNEENNISGFLLSGSRVRNLRFLKE